MTSVGPEDKAKGIALMTMACLSVGVIETASLSLAPLSCPPEDLGVALGTLGSIRSAGGSICSERPPLPCKTSPCPIDSLVDTEKLLFTSLSWPISWRLSRPRKSLLLR